MARELILKLGKKITDRVDVKLGMTKLDENSPEYYGLASVVTDEMAELALAMKVRVPTTPAEIGKKVGKDPVYVEQLFDQMSMIGLLEYNWENPERAKQWVLPMLVPGSAEFLNMRVSQLEEHPVYAKFFEQARVAHIVEHLLDIGFGHAGELDHLGQRIGTAHLHLAEHFGLLISRGLGKRPVLVAQQLIAMQQTVGAVLAQLDDGLARMLRQRRHELRTDVGLGVANPRSVENHGCPFSCHSPARPRHPSFLQAGHPPMPFTRH
mgnify:CR=1 FL=1